MVTITEGGVYYLTLLRLHAKLRKSDAKQDRIEAIGVYYAIRLLEEHCDELPVVD
jgi:hypothetical protein